MGNSISSPIAGAVTLILALLSANISSEARTSQNQPSEPTKQQEYDVVVVGATPPGIAAAIAAARLGSRVALVEDSSHIGGMYANGGMCYTDIWIRRTESRLFAEYAQRIRQHYTPDLSLSPSALLDLPPFRYSWSGYFWEPSVAERTLNQMVEEEPLITVLLGCRLLSVSRRGRQIVGARFETAQGAMELNAKVFIDATYEGDLAATAGAEYRVGREGRSEYNEQHAGVIYQDMVTKTIYSGSTGRGDTRLPSYTVQLVVTNNTQNQVPIGRPDDYDRNRYLGLLDDIRQGYVKGIGDIYRFVPAGLLSLSSGATGAAVFPSSTLQKYCLNNTFKAPISADLPGENAGYPDGDPATRDRIYRQHLNHTLGLLYFLQNDPIVPEDLRQGARQWGLAADEFVDNGSVPRELYVREARRIVGEYILTENDLRVDPENQLEPGSPVQIEPPWMFGGYPHGIMKISNQRPPIHADSISVAGYFPESRAARPWHPGHEEDRHVFEGMVLLDRVALPAQLPYRIMIPATVDRLLVPVAVSATHIAFSAIRMEPTWMALGEAAGTAAHLAASSGVPPRKISVDYLQRVLLEQGQVITFFNDVTFVQPHFHALQYFGTKGFFPDFTAWPDKSVTWGLALRWLSHARQRPESELKLIVAGPSATTFNPEAELSRETALAWTGQLYADSPSVVASIKLGDWLLSNVSGPLERLALPVTRSEFCQLLYLLETANSEPGQE
jgi:hypothetical protein